MGIVQGSARLNHLDGLRGVAAMVVVVAHFCQFFLPAIFDSSATKHGFGERLIATTPLNIFVSGAQAVSIFFVLSGIVLSAPFFSGKGRAWYLQAALKRYPRLAIPVLASVLIAWLIAKTIGFHYGDAIGLTGATMRDRFATIDSICTALWQGSIGAFFLHEDSYNPVLWTISIELIGSLMVFAAVPIIGAWRFRWLVYVAAGIALENTNLLGFVLGIALADAMQRQWLPSGRVTLMACTITGLWLGSYPYYGAESGIWSALPAGHDVTYHVVGAMLMVVAIAGSERAKAILSSHPFAFLGTISYGLYLTHFQVLGSIGALSVLAIGSAHPYGIAVATTAAWVIPACIAWAWAFSRLVDQPAIAAAGRFARSVTGRLRQSGGTALSQESASLRL